MLTEMLQDCIQTFFTYFTPSSVRKRIPIKIIENDAHKLSGQKLQLRDPRNGILIC